MDKLPGIIKGCKKKNPVAQKALYELLSAKMYGVCLRYSGGYDDAQDILQDGFVKIFEKISQYEGKGSFEGWVRRIFVNTALEKYRGQARMIASDDHLLKLNNTDHFDPVNDQMTEKELLELIRELSPKYRVVFNLYAIEGYSHKEISEMLGITEGTSKSNLSRARTILQQKVTQYYHHERSVI